MRGLKAAFPIMLFLGITSVVPMDAQENRTLSSVTTSQIRVTSGRTETGTVTGSQTLSSGDNISITVTGFNTNVNGESLWAMPVMGSGYCGFSNNGDHTFVLTKTGASQPFSGGTYTALNINDGIMIAFTNDGSQTVTSNSLGDDADKSYTYSYIDQATGASGTFKTGKDSWYTTTGRFYDKVEVTQSYSVAFFPKDSGFIAGQESLKNAKVSLSTAFAEQKINSLRDGVLIANSANGNGDVSSAKMMPLADGSGYNLQSVNHERANQGENTLINYAFLPYGTEGLAAGIVLTHTSDMWTGGSFTESFSISSTENFTITRTDTGTYTLKFTDESGFSSQNGSLFVTGFATQGYGKYEGFNGWNENENGDSFKCWFTAVPNDDKTYTIQSFEYLRGQNGAVTPVDANFSFAFISNDGLGEAKFSETYNPGFDPGMKGSSAYSGALLTFDYSGNSNNYRCFSNMTSTAQYLKLDTLSQNGDFWFALNGNRLGSRNDEDTNGMLDEGVILATIAENGTNAVAKADAPNYRGMISIEHAGNGQERNVNFSTAFFPKSGPWTVGRTNNADASSLWGNTEDFTITKTGTGTYTLKIDGGSPKDGTLLAIGRSNETRSLVVAAPNDADGWTLNVLNAQNASRIDDGRGISFVYLPSDLGYLTGTVLADGTVENAPLESLISVEDLGIGKWAITPDDSIDADSYFLLLTSADTENPAYLSYEPEFDADGSVVRFLIEAMSPGADSNLTDTAFSFALMSSYGFTHSTGVPEPSAFTLLVSALSFLSVYVWRRKNGVQCVAK